MADNEPFLQRLIRRKNEALVAKENLDVEELPEQDSENMPATVEGETNPEQSDAKQVEQEEERELTDEDMPPLDELDEHSDYSLFMSKGVSEELRRQALKKLFGLPEFNVRDGLNEYDDDYTKLKPLAADMVDKVRSWARNTIEERKQEAEEKLKQSLKQPEQQAPEARDDETPEPDQTRPSDSARDDIGDADQQG